MRIGSGCLSSFNYHQSTAGHRQICSAERPPAGSLGFGTVVGRKHMGVGIAVFCNWCDRTLNGGNNVTGGAPPGSISARILVLGNQNRLEWNLVIMGFNKLSDTPCGVKALWSETRAALLPLALSSLHTLTALRRPPLLSQDWGSSKDCCGTQLAVWLFFPQSLHAPSSPLSMAGLEVGDSWPTRSDSSFPGVFVE